VTQSLGAMPLVRLHNANTDLAVTLLVVMHEDITLQAQYVARKTG
jgi:hypothetical protein